MPILLLLGIYGGTIIIIIGVIYSIHHIIGIFWLSFIVSTMATIGIVESVKFLAEKKWGGCANQHFYLGLKFAKEGRSNKSLVEYENAIKNDPKLWQAYFNAASIYYNRNRYDKALEYMTIVVKLKPKFAMGYFHLGKILQTKGLETWNWDEAIKAYHKALELKLPRKEKIQCHLILAHTYLELGKFEKAEEELEITLKLDPKNSDAKKLKKELTNKGLITKAREQKGCI